MARTSWQIAHYSFFANRECEYFPCHATDDPDNFNCLFCYCPLYMLGRKCGGKFRYNGKGIKICTDCSFPHRRENYPVIVKRYLELVALMQKLETLEQTEQNGQTEQIGQTEQMEKTAQAGRNTGQDMEKDARPDPAREQAS